MVYDQNPSWLKKAVKVGYGQTLIMLISTKVRQMGKGITHANDGVKAFRTFVLFHVFTQSEPIGFFDD